MSKCKKCGKATQFTFCTLCAKEVMAEFSLEGLFVVPDRRLNVNGLQYEFHIDYPDTFRVDTLSTSLTSEEVLRVETLVRKYKVEIPTRGDPNEKRKEVKGGHFRHSYGGSVDYNDYTPLETWRDRD